VQLERVAQHDRLQQVALELVHGDDDDDHDDRGGEVVRHERDERREDARDGRADDRHERADEHHERERQRERHAQDEESRADEDRVDERDGRGAADVAAEHLRALVAHAHGALAAAAAERAEEEGPDPRPVLDEVEEDDEPEHRARDDLGGGGDSRDGAGSELAAGEEVDRLLAEGVDLRRVDRQPALLDERLQLVDALAGGLHEGRPLALHPEDDGRDGAAEEHEPGEERDDRGERVRDAAALHPEHHRAHGAGEDQRDDHRDHDELERDGGVHDRDGDHEDRQDLHAADGEAAELVLPDGLRGGHALHPTGGRTRRPGRPPGPDTRVTGR
jgi:hypothetical protein